ncbi:MAG: hypothetical protein ABW171_15965 [Steroidobacter sp.]
MTTTPGYWQSKSGQHGRADDDKLLSTRTDAVTFALHQQFTRAHGAPKGELTTLVTDLVDGGVFVSNGERQ